MQELADLASTEKLCWAHGISSQEANLLCDQMELELLGHKPAQSLPWNQKPAMPRGLVSQPHMPGVLQAERNLPDAQEAFL